jgi:hypothetical protein
MTLLSSDRRITNQSANSPSLLFQKVHRSVSSPLTVRMPKPKSFQKRVAMKAGGLSVQDVMRLSIFCNHRPSNVESANRQHCSLARSDGIILPHIQPSHGLESQDPRIRYHLHASARRVDAVTDRSGVFARRHAHGRLQQCLLRACTQPSDPKPTAYQSRCRRDSCTASPRTLPADPVATLRNASYPINGCTSATVYKLPWCSC